MKNFLTVISLFTILLWSCEGKFNEGKITFYDIPEPLDTTALDPFVRIGKKGIGLTVKNKGWSFKVSTLKVHWHYSWGSSLSELEPDNVDFVPMFWGRGVTRELVDQMKTLKDEGKITYLLGFNEPDGEEQANMTVDEAIDLWPMLEEVGVPLGSPGAVNPTGQWMQEFMQKANEKGLRIDFVCVHWYGGVSAQGLLNKLQEVYTLYGLPIWITEFASADWNATTPEENRYSPEQVLTFMKTVLPQLEELGYLERYAWFPFGLDRAQGTSSALFDADGNLTTLGEFYTNFEPNTFIGEGKEPYVEPGIVFQDNFEDYSAGTSLSNSGYIVWEGSASVVSGDAFEGDQFGQSDASKNNFAIRIPLSLEAGKSYTVEVATKIEDGAGHTLQVHPKAAYDSAWVACSNAGWEVHETEFTVTEGNEDVVVALYRWPKKKMSFDNLVVREVD